MTPATGLFLYDNPIKVVTASISSKTKLRVPSKGSTQQHKSFNSYSKLTSSPFLFFSKYFWLYKSNLDG